MAEYNNYFNVLINFCNLLKSFENLSTDYRVAPKNVCPSSLPNIACTWRFMDGRFFTGILCSLTLQGTNHYIVGTAMQWTSSTCSSIMHCIQSDTFTKCESPSLLSLIDNVTLIAGVGNRGNHLYTITTYIIFSEMEQFLCRFGLRLDLWYAWNIYE